MSFWPTPEHWSVKIPLQHLSKLAQREILQLPNALARHTELLAHVFQGPFVASIQAEAKTQDAGFAVRQLLDEFEHFRRRGAMFQTFRRTGGRVYAMPDGKAACQDFQYLGLTKYG